MNLLPAKLEQAFYNPSKKYVMGVDAYDDKANAACVMDESGVVVYIGKGHKEDMEKEIGLIAAYFHIPKENILTETK